MLWQPSPERSANTAMQQFMHCVASKYSIAIGDYAGLHQFSISQPAEFWKTLLEFFPIKIHGSLEPAVTDLGFKEYGWFPNAKLNFAENLLANGAANQVAIKSLLENGNNCHYTYAQLREQVAGAVVQLGENFKVDDVLACYMPNIAETVIAMLATTARGGIFTSTSADFGVDGVVDRFGQSKPKVLVTCAGYQYNGKYYDILDKVAAIVEQLPSVEKVLIVDRYHKQPDIGHIDNSEFWQPRANPPEIEFIPRDFSAPLYIMYSSGTTGKPKCIVHATGGVLLQHIKELGLHSDHNATKNIFFFTTCGWMMWNWLVSSLYFGGTTTLYEGSPAYPSFSHFLGLIKRENINILGTSPKYLKALQDSDTDLTQIDFEPLETVLCTGSPLLPEQYDFVYNNIKADLLLASISGGTDIIGCFFLGNPILPVYRGELQCAGLGMDVVCINERGKSVVAEQGELICRQSFPSRPIYFLNDPFNEKLNDAYFNERSGVWTHGDFIEITERGGAIFYGRSDATLNPGGVRIGTSEIYRQTEALDYIEDSVCVGKQIEGDVDVVLFVKLVPDQKLDETRIAEIKTRIKSNTTPRHVPKYIFAVHDIPYTRSGKKIELAVSKLINGKSINNREAIANPDCLEEYTKFFH
ncbi:acetoacetyl-CoA synthetase [Alteromonadaceae bacterium 2753L.S.0a.02]|nr:acetoacetyl-CoA synthetase [Alteromonadaceae bacterium 2753L.S.0a.02]